MASIVSADVEVGVDLDALSLAFEGQVPINVGLVLKFPLHTVSSLKSLSE